MHKLLEIHARDIARLDPQRLTDLLDKLLNHEAVRHGIPRYGIQVGTQINVPDGGIDAFIEWTDGPTHTDFLPCQKCAFQVKSGDVTRSKLKKEIEKNGDIKPGIDRAFKSNATYILFTNQPKNRAQIDELREEFLRVLRLHSKDYADSASIEVYTADCIARWINSFLQVIIDVRHWLNQPVPRGLMGWELWNKFEDRPLKTKFVSDEAREGVIDTIRETLVVEKTHLRILGLSGIGKTRVALEAFVPSSVNTLSDQVVYVDTFICKDFDAGVLQTWIQRDLGGILIVDNCDLVLHQSLVRQVMRSESKFSLLTLHYETSQSDNTTPTFKLSKMDDKFIEEILEPVYRQRIPDFERVVQFAQGFPQMAVLLAEARLEQHEDIGKLTDSVMLERLLGENREIPHQKKILEACALFEKFGFEEEPSIEYKFIAKNIAQVDSQTLYRCIKHHMKRGIVIQAGRYAQVVPKPLAISLAADCWELTTEDVIEKLLNHGMPGQLETSFCDQVAKLDFLPLAKERASKLCGEQGPFGQAEVILSQRGARLFRSFVELDPRTTAKSLHRVLSSLDDEELFKVSGDTRRNLIFALERLCFRIETFERGAWSLMLLAANENENYGNNATGLFVQLFQVSLSGTSAPPDMRIRLIDSILELNSEAKGKLVINALSTALNPYRNSRLIGAEFQGSNESLQEWHPTVWQDAFDYWISSIERLTEITLSDSSLWTLARKELGKNIRPLAFTSKVVIDVLDEAIHKVVCKRGPLWTEAVESILHAIEYDSNEKPAYAIEKLQEWEQVLQPTESDERLDFYVISPITHFPKKAGGEIVDYAREKAESLAEEFAHDVDSFIPHIPKLLETVPKQGFNFGRCIAIHSTKWEEVFDRTVNSMKECSEPSINFLRGLLVGIHERDPAIWNEQLTNFSEDPLFSRYYPQLLTTGSISEHHLITVIEKLRAQAFDIESLVILGQGRNLNMVSSSALNHFLNDIIEYSPRAPWVALDILTMHCHGLGTFDSFRDILRKITLEIPSAWEHRSGSSIDSYAWKKAVINILSRENEKQFAITISKNVLNLVSHANISETSHVVEPIIREVLKRYSDDVWDEISSYIDQADYLERFHLRQLFRCETFGDRESRVSLFDTVPDQLIKEWCEKSPEIGPQFVAETTELFQYKADRIEISQRGQYLIDNFGNSDSVLDAIDANLGSLWFVDSAEIHYQREIDLLKRLNDHPIGKVRSWSNDRILGLEERITQEQRRLEERAIGIF